MSSEQIQCMYCGTPQHVTPRRSGNRSILKRMLYSPVPESTSKICISCTVCGNDYSMILIGDVSYWRANLVPSNGLLEDTKRKLNDDSIEWENVLCSIIGIAEYSDGSIHVGFQICNIRGYFDGMRGGSIITLLSVWRVNDE